MNSLTASCSSNPLVRITGTPGAMRCICRKASAPSMRGMFMSSTTALRRAAWFRNTSTPSTPSSAVSTAKPLSSSMTRVVWST